MGKAVVESEVQEELIGKLEALTNKLEVDKDELVEKALEEKIDEVIRDNDLIFSSHKVFEVYEK